VRAVQQSGADIILVDIQVEVPAQAEISCLDEIDARRVAGFTKSMYTPIPAMASTGNMATPEGQ
jgi:hypothetical protein